MFQVCTVCLLFFLTLLELVEMLLKQRRMDGGKAALWLVRARRIGAAKKNFRTSLLTFGGPGSGSRIGRGQISGRKPDDG